MIYPNQKGPSVNTDPYNKNVVKQDGGPFKILSLPEGLQYKATGSPGHYEIVTSKAMTIEQYQSLLNQIHCCPIKI